MKLFIYLGIIAALCSCRELIEPTLEKEKVNIVTPQDTTFKTYTVNFTWEELEYATKYQVKVVQLDSMGRLQYDILVDSMVTTNSFRYTFAPTYYEVWVRAMNSSSSSAWTIKRIKIVRAALSQQKIVLSNPKHKQIFNIDNQIVGELYLEWVGIPEKRLDYIIQVDTIGDFKKPIKDTVSEASYKIQPIRDGTYYWKVKALRYDNTGAYVDSTEWSDRYYFTYDMTAPALVSMTEPSNGALKESTSGLLKWSDNQKNVSYIVNVKYGDGTSKATPTNSKEFFYDVGTATNKTVKWSVDTKDNAGNINRGPMWSFTAE